MSGYVNGKSIDLASGDARFKELAPCLDKATVLKVTQKTRVEGTTTVSITIPYAIGFIVDFQMNDGSTVRFSTGANNLWFETDQAIYQASVDPGLDGMLRDLLP